MTKTLIAAKSAQKKPRADAQRNREHILEIAKQVFTDRGSAASMDEIARTAKIGPGTLYRHFPNRDDLLAAVYISEVEKLTAAEATLSTKLEPMEALRAWMLLFVEYVAAKKIIAPALNAMSGGPSRIYERTNLLMTEAANSLARRAVESGDLRPDIDVMDLLRALYGVTMAGEANDWPNRARQMVDILLSGARAVTRG